MRLIASPIAASALGVLVLAAAPSPAGDLRGYSADAAKVEREWETKFRAIPSPDSLREYMRHLAARPHHVGSPYDKANAEWILAKFKSFGLDAQIETFDVLFPTPKERVVELVAPTKFVAKLQEPAVPGDPTSSQEAEQLPSYNAYSVDGDVTVPLVYVNYGVPADYDRLERLGISDRAVARHQAQGRGRARRGRLPHLLGPAGGRLRPGRRLPPRAVAAPGRGATRQRDGHAGVSRRSPDARGGGDQGREAPGAERGADDHQDSGPADLVRRRRAVARRAHRSDGPPGVARRARHHVPRRTRAGQSAPAGQVRLEPEAAVRRDRAHPGRERPG